MHLHARDFDFAQHQRSHVEPQIGPLDAQHLVALPLAFIVTFAAGVVLERLVIRHLVKRPLETLLATFGMAYFQYDKGQGINGFWTLIAGGMGAVALWALSDLVKLLVALAQAVSAEGGVMDVD